MSRFPMAAALLILLASCAATARVVPDNTDPPPAQTAAAATTAPPSETAGSENSACLPVTDPARFGVIRSTTDMLNARRAAPRANRSPTTGAVPPYFVKAPNGWSAKNPIRMLLALHGVGGNGADFAAPLVTLAQKYGWLLVSATLPYSNYDDVVQARADEPIIVDRLERLLADVPARTKLTVKPGVFGLGFSRGGAVLQRFAMTHPTRFAGLTMLAPGGNTVPFACASLGEQTADLPFPMGTLDIAEWSGAGFEPSQFRQIALWVGVGDRDNDVTTPWAGLLGSGRRERVQGYVQAMKELGAKPEYIVYPQLGHDVTAAELQDATGFLRRLDASAA